MIMPTLLFVKAEQLGLFATPTHVEGHTRKDGTYVAPHIALRRKRLEPHHQASLVAHHERPDHAVGATSSPALDKFIAKHGGPARLADTLRALGPEPRAKLIDAMATVGGIDAKAVMVKLGVAGDQDQGRAEESGRVQESINSTATDSKPIEQTGVPASGKPASEFKYFADFARDRLGVVPSIGSEDHARIKAEWDAAPRPADDTKDRRSAALAVLGDGWKAENGTEGAKDLYRKMVGRLEVIVFPQKTVTGNYYVGGYYKSGPRKGPAGVDTSASTLEDAARIANGMLTAYHKEGDTKIEDGIEYQLRDGRWHRTTPRDEPGTEEFTGVDDNTDDAVTSEVAARLDRAAKLRDASRKVIARADEELGRDRLANTHKRAGQAAHAIQQAEHARAIGLTMGNLADAIESGQAGHLDAISSKAAVETLEAALDRAMWERDRGLSYADQQKRKGRPPEPEDIKHAKLPKVALHGNVARSYASDLRKIGRHGLADTLERRHVGDDVPIRLSEDEANQVVDALTGKGKMTRAERSQYEKGKAGLATPWHLDGTMAVLNRLRKIGIRTDLDLRMALAEFVMFRSGARKADPIKEAERALIGLRLPGFFPTPESVVSRMIGIAGIQPGMKVLEPSAGKGNIADEVRAAGVVPDVVEISQTLRTILEAKGYRMAGHDFNDIPPRAEYDAVLMNPPFENGQDADHVRRAYLFLKPGGTIVAVMSSGTFFRSDKKAEGFRDWLANMGGESEQLPAGTFLESERQTGVNTHLVTLRKPLTAEADDDLARVALAEDKADLAEALRSSPDAQETQDMVRKVHEAEAKATEEGPKDGDTQEENGVTYILRDGRWHRQDKEESGFTPGSIDRTKAMLALHSKIEELGGKEKLSAMFRQSKRNPELHMQAEEILRRFGETLGMSRDETLAEFGLKEKVETRTGGPKPKDTGPVNEGGAFDDLDPGSPNYRYRDTGYIPGSRKEDAANAIKAAAARGEQNTYTSINWDELEKNPRQAKDVITKSNLFGVVDWESLKANGMDPAAGFLIDRVYAAIAPEPGEHGTQARKDYALGLESLRARLEKCKTTADVTTVLEELRQEYDGGVLNAEETARYQELSGVASALWEQNRALDAEKAALWETYNGLNGQRNSLKWEQEKRVRRGWKPDPEIDQKMEALGPAIAAADQALSDWKAAHPEAESKKREFDRWSAYDNDIEWEARKARDAMTLIVQGAKLRNKTDNPLHRAWNIMGERFQGVLRYRRNETFGKHVAAAKSGQIKDWSWAEKTVTRAPRVSKESVRFQLKVAERYERVGGRSVSADSTAALKALFGLRDVQSGNWVLRDVNAAKFHVEHCAAALADLADMVGAPDDLVSMNGRLAMAFGARGKGATGWADSAPRATYESVHRVINLTKNGGGGALGHEWFHALDNMITEAETGNAGGKDDYLSENPDLLPAGELRDAFAGLRRAIHGGEHRLTKTLEYSAQDHRLAKHNLGGMYVNQVGKSILGAGDVHRAVQAIERTFPGDDRKSKKRRADWTRIAIAHYGGNPEGGTIHVMAGKPMSSFAMEAVKLDDGEHGRYWSRGRELAARAFQAWCEDRLAAQGRKNDYLSVYADNQYYKNPIFGDTFPFPEGEERKRINDAFDLLFEAVRRRGTLAKALEMLERS